MRHETPEVRLFQFQILIILPSHQLKYLSVLLALREFSMNWWCALTLDLPSKFRLRYGTRQL